MNERFKELADDAAAIVGNFGSSAEFAQTFAELIVKECVGLVEINMPTRRSSDTTAILGAILAHFEMKP